MVRLKKIKTNWFMTPLGFAREIIWVDAKGNIIKKKIERKKRK